MRIIVWGINYAPELTGIGPYNTALCEFLQRQGHAVQMVTTFPYYPEWKKRPGGGHSFRKEVANGVEIFRCWHYVPQRVTTLRRIAHELSFVATSLARTLFLPAPDLFIIISPPLLLGLAGYCAEGIKRAPFVMHIQDLQPDAAAGLGLIQPGPLLRLLYRIESFVYAHAARVSGISMRMIQRFEQKGVPRDKLIFFPNGVVVGEVPARSGRFREKHGINSEDFLIVYSGNLGVKQGLENVIEAAAGLTNGAIRLVICGDGAHRRALEEMARARAVKNLSFVPLQPAEQFQEMLADADLCLVTQKSGTGDYFFPSKLLPLLAAGRPVVTVTDESSELAAAVREGKFGMNVAPDRPGDLARTMESLAGRPAQLSAWGAAGRRFAERFRMEEVLGEFAANLERLKKAHCQEIRSPSP